MTPSLAVHALLAIARHTPLGRGQLRRYLTRIIEHNHKGPIDTTFHGVPIRLHMDNTTERKALFGHYDEKELAFIGKAVFAPRSVFLDIGANAGLYTVCMSSWIGAGSRIIAIEPNPRMLDRIDYNLSLSAEGRYSRGVEVSIERCAVGSHTGTSFLDLANGFGSAHLTATYSTESIRVPVRTLLDIARQHDIEKIDALKIDIEGYEDRALVPFLSEAKPSMHPKVIVIEHTHRANWNTDVITLCESIGYRSQGRTRGNLLLSR